MEQFDKQIKELENKIDSEEKKQALLNDRTREYEAELKEATSQVNELSKELDNTADKATKLQEAIRNTRAGSYERFDLKKQYDEVWESGHKLLGELEKAEAKQNNLKDKVAKTKLQYENSAKAIDKMRGKLELVNMKRHLFQMKEFEKGVNKVKDGIQNTIGKIGKMAMAVLGVRSAFMLVRQASSTWAQYNEQYAKDLEYIRFALASGLAPVLEKIVRLAQTLMAYVNYLTNALFGRPFFGSAKDFESMQKSAGGIAKSTKDIKNNLAGFDELNVLSSNQDTGGIGGGVTAPSLDLEKVEIPEWLVKLKDILQPVVDFFKQINKEYGPVATGIGIVVSALAGFWILKSIIGLFTGFSKAFAGFSADFTGFFNALGRAVEAIAVLGGLALVIESITKLIDVFSQSGMTLGEVAGLLGIVLGEVAVAFIVLMGAITALKPSWQSIAGAVVILGGMALVLHEVTSLIQAFSESGMSLNEVIGLMATVLISIVATMGAVALIGPAMTAGLLPFLVVVGGISAILAVMALTLPTILEAVEKFITGTAPSLTTIIESIARGIAIIIDSIGTALPPIIESVGTIFTTIFDGIAKIIETVADTIIKLEDSTLEFINKLGPAINSFVDGVIEAVTKLINFIISGIEYMVNLVIKGVNKIIDAVNSVGEFIGIVIPRVPEFEIPRFVPKLAKGGIVAKPTQAIIGEAGREAVMPLDNNTEWMDLLADKLSDRMTSGSGNQEVVIRFEGTMAQFVRELKPHIEIENRRAGARIITGGAY